MSTFSQKKRGSPEKEKVDELTSSVKITVVFDNYQHLPQLETAFGFACVVETVNRRVLFDTGSDGGILLANMDVLNLPPGGIDAIVLSHNHWDHTGGLEYFLVENSDVDVYLPISFPDDFKSGIVNSGARIFEVDSPTEIFDGLHSTGEIPGVVCEQSLICSTNRGSVVITGCAHPGIVRILKEADSQQGHVYMVMGGFHLRNESLGSIQKTVEEINGIGVNLICPSHCTGDEARELFQELFGQRCTLCGAGSRFSLDSE